MKFRIFVQGPQGNIWPETYERVKGQGNYVPGVGTQPTFEGDIEKWGKALIDWFNSTEPNEKNHRKFLRAEMVE